MSPNNVGFDVWFFDQQCPNSTHDNHHYISSPYRDGGNCLRAGSGRRCNGNRWGDTCKRAAAAENWMRKRLLYQGIAIFLVALILVVAGK